MTLLVFRNPLTSTLNGTNLTRRGPIVLSTIVTVKVFESLGFIACDARLHDCYLPYEIKKINQIMMENYFGSPDCIRRPSAARDRPALHQPQRHEVLGVVSAGHPGHHYAGDRPDRFARDAGRPLGRRWSGRRLQSGRC